MSTGYKGSPPESPDEYPKFFRLDRIKNMRSERIMAKLLRNGESIGLLHLDNEEDFEWLAKRIQGTRAKKIG